MKLICKYCGEQRLESEQLKILEKNCVNCNNDLFWKHED